MFQTKIVENIKTTTLCLIFFDNIAFYEITWKNTVERGGPHDACTFHAGYLGLQISKLRLCNTHCFPTTTMVVRTCPNVTLYIHWLSYFDSV